MLHTFMAKQSAAVFVDLPKDISAAQRAVLVSGFEAGRSRIVFTFTLKLSYMMEPPWLLCSSAHHDRSRARGCHSEMIGLQ